MNNEEHTPTAGIIRRESFAARERIMRKAIRLSVEILIDQRVSAEDRINLCGELLVRSQDEEKSIHIPKSINPQTK